MLQNFNDMPGRSRVWIYQADRPLTTQEQSAITKQGNQFFAQWVAHGKDLHSAFRIFHSQFLVVALDESSQGATGCSIDASVHFIQGLEQQLAVSFFDRTKIAFAVGDEVRLVPMAAIKEHIEQGLISAESTTFNNLVANKEQFEQAWQVPAKNSWLSRYF